MLIETTCAYCGAPTKKSRQDYERYEQHYCSRACTGKGLGLRFAASPEQRELMLRAQRMSLRFATWLEHFWSEVDQRGPRDCWEWRGQLYHDGYGRFDSSRYGRSHGDKKTHRAHRVSWEIANGPIPDGLGVLHKCDNPKCVNPTHLFLGTQTDNMRDMSRKGRAPHPPQPMYQGNSYFLRVHPDRSPTAKVTPEQVRVIKSRLMNGEAVKVIARDFGVRDRLVYDIVRGVTWQSVTL